MRGSTAGAQPSGGGVSYRGMLISASLPLTQLTSEATGYVLIFEKRDSNC